MPLKLFNIYLYDGAFCKLNLHDLLVPDGRRRFIRAYTMHMVALFGRTRILGKEGGGRWSGTRGFTWKICSFRFGDRQRWTEAEHAAGSGLV